ncbi:MAG: hypothetical protein AAFP08_04810 [Bacteroidota bacterium]
MRHLFFIIFLSISHLSFTQPVDGFFSDIRNRIEQGDILRITGQATGQFDYNSISGIVQRRPGFNARLQAGLGIDLMGIQIPASIAIARGGTVYNYQLPSYAFVGLSPSYKWITLHAGDRSMSFSPYVLNGLSYRGAGIELTPGKWRLAAMYGRLRRATAVNAGSIQRLESPYQRMGGGLQLGYQDEKTEVKLSIFSAADQAENQDPLSVDSLDRPERNVCLGLSFNQQISDKLIFQSEWALSALTRDQQQPALENATSLQRLFGLFNPRISTGYHQAYQFGIQFNPEPFDLLVQFERIDPGYRTLGSLYFQNDIENITSQVSLPIEEGKYQVQGRVGLQRNNLNQSSGQNGFKRFIGSLALSAQWTAGINSQINWSNFRTTNRIRAINVPFVEIDSIVIVQSNNNINLVNTFQLDKNGRQFVTSNFTFQDAQTIRNDDIQGDGNSQFLMALIAYNLSFTHGEDRRSNISASILAHQNQLPTGKVILFGPSIGYQIKWGKELPLQLGATAALSQVNAEGQEASDLFRFQISGNYQMFKASQLGITATYLDNQSSGQPFRELTIGLRFGYTFGIKERG